MKHLLVSACLLAFCACSGIIQNGTLPDGEVIGVTNGPTNNFPQGAHPAALQVLNPNGSILATPTLQIVTFNDDVNAAQLESFGKELGASSYWTTLMQEYGVQGLQAATPLREQVTWSPNITDGQLLGGEKSDIETYLVAQLDGQAPPWGVPRANTIYLLAFPAGIAVSPDGGQTPSACAANILAWHTALLLPQSNVTIPYVVLPNCGALTGLSAIDSLTFPASHEIVAAATNPHLNGFNTLDANHAFWQLASGGSDIAAACVAQQYGSANLLTHPQDLPFAVQRVWSNAQAKAGHVPCLPAATHEVFFDAVPVVQDAVSVKLTTNDLVPPASTVGAHIAVGSTAVVPLALFADGQVAGPWKVQATELGTQDLTLTLDKSAGNNGDTINLTITVNNAAASAQELVRVSSTLGNITNNEFIIVHN